MSYTKGEWTVHKWETKNGIGCQVNCNNEALCTLMYKDHEANAKLIAASPALLEALQELLQVKEWKDKHGKDEHYLKAQPSAWSNAIAAIQKATL